jgi:AraC-like DNA-binding protein
MMEAMSEDRRKYARFPLDLPAKMSADGSGGGWDVRFRDLSRGGAFFLSDQPVGLGDWLEIQLGGGLVFRGQVVRLAGSIRDKYGFAVRFPDGERFRHPDSPAGDAKADAAGADGWSDAYQLELRRLNEEAFGYYDRLERVRDFVQANFSEEITLETAAGVAAMERTYFSFFFRQKVGVTFSSWLQYVRIGKALDMIKSKDHSITDVAFSVGFNELSTFQKAFKRWTNLTPREFKRLARPA